ncbi:HNH endonuclease [Nonomuraea angiospora]|uniref:HNH endonuclease n=1 Tax=Nonomuraea angiospora TaxID=46172 RepID=UPI0037A62A98
MSGGPAACWPFEGAKPGKYGLVQLGAYLVGSTAAFVVAYCLARGLVKAPASGHVIRHLCNNKPCCNPAHLLLGTHQENALDRLAAQRDGSTGPRLVDEPVPPPQGGWIIPSGDMEELERRARASEFWQRVDRSGGEDSCWPWIGRGKHKFGYGQMKWMGIPMTSHRIAYILSNDLAPEDVSRNIHIRHRCPPGGSPNNCNNPKHLLPGTAADNRADCKEDGNMPMGEKHHKGRNFQDALIREIREHYWTAPAEVRPTLTALACRHGVSISTISSWLTGKTRLAAGGPTSRLR